MRRLDRVQPIALHPQDADHAFDAAGERDEFAGKVWLTQREAAIYTRRPNVRAFYEWRKRHGIVSHRGLIAKADLVRVLRLRKVQPTVQRLRHSA